MHKLSFCGGGAHFGNIAGALLSALLCAGSLGAADQPPNGVTLVDLTSPSSTAPFSTTEPDASKWNGSFANAFDDGDNSTTASRAMYKFANEKETVYSISVDIGYTFNSPTAVNSYRITMLSADSVNVQERAPKSWTFQGSDDKENWTTLDTRSDETGWTLGEKRYFAFRNETTYSHYRILFTSVVDPTANKYGGFLQIGELEFFYFRNMDDWFPKTAGFAKHFDITVAGVPEGTSLTNFPVLVRLSTERVRGFSYEDIKRQGHRDIMFVSSDGKFMPHEIDTWGGDSGETLIWVRVPLLQKGTTFRMYYGNEAEDAVNDTARVWTSYAGVWHYSGGATADSTSQGLNSRFDKNAQQSSDGRVGDGASNGVTYNALPFSVLDDKSKFAATGWFRPSANNATARLISSKANYDKTGFELMYVAGTGLYLRGNGNSKTVMYKPATATDAMPTGSWIHYAGIANDTTGAIYMNGAKLVSADIDAVNGHEGGKIAFGGDAGGGNLFSGLYDELRVYNGVPSDAWIKAECDSVDAAFLAYGVANETDASIPDMEPAVVTRNANGDFTVSVEVLSGSGTVSAVFVNGQDEVTVALATSDADFPKTFSATATGLVSDKTYALRLVATGNTGATETRSGPTVYTGDISIAAGGNADEMELVPGSFVISRTDSAGDLAVAYTVGGTATEGTSYETLSGAATIPDGETSVTVSVVPKLDMSLNEDATVVLTLAAGLYGISSTASSATIVLLNVRPPEGYNTWIAAEAGKASVAANWSAGAVPQSGDNVRFDGRFSSADCEWDAGVNGLSSSVGSWEQIEGYAGTVTVDTEFDTYSGATFTCLTVNGDFVVNSGTLTHPVSLYETEGGPCTVEQMRARQRYRLRVDVKGAMTIGAGASVDIRGKGYWYYGQGFNLASAHGGSCWEYRGYGNPKKPVDVAMGGCFGTDSLTKCAPGAGAAYLTVAQGLVVNGTINADGDDNPNGGTAGGSVYVEAQSVTGTGSIHANGRVPSTDKASGAGGRIALITTAAVDLTTLSVKATAGGRPIGNGVGTVYLKDSSMTYGVLRVVGNPGDNARTGIKAVADVTEESDWTFDEIVVGGAGRVGIPSGRTLTLPNGLESVRSIDDDAFYSGLFLDGGTLAAGNGDQTLKSKWLFCSRNPYTFPANVTLRDGARMGIHFLDQSGLGGLLVADFTVNGNLTVGSDSAVSVSQIYCANGETDKYPYGAYGGWSLRDSSARTNTYGSVFRPVHPGTSPNKGFPGCGVLKLVVMGDLVVRTNAHIVANAATSDSTWDGCCAASGGSVDVTARTISGEGSITARGGAAKINYAGGAGGGRVAIRLTGESAGFDPRLHINAEGKTFEPVGWLDDSNYRASSAGTVYLQTAAQGEGRGVIRIANDGLAGNRTTTPIVAYGEGKDDVSAFKHASLYVGGRAIAEVSADFIRMASLEVEENSKIELMGRTLSVAKATVGGTKLASGTYTAATLPDYLQDSAEGAGGKLVISSGLAIMVR